MLVVIVVFHLGWGRHIIAENERIKGKDIGGTVDGPVAIKI